VQKPKQARVLRGALDESPMTEGEMGSCSASAEALNQSGEASESSDGPPDRATVRTRDHNRIHIAIIADKTGKRVKRQTVTVEELRDLIVQTTAPTKLELKWFKLATFGDQRSPKGSLRHDANVISVNGVELDYDSEAISFEEAVNIAARGRVRSILYTTPSHTDAKPRWRILCPTSCELAPAERYGMAARVNGLYGGVFAPESFILSQGFVFGSVAGNPPPPCRHRRRRICRPPP
jgi:hypothetical protein